MKSKASKKLKVIQPGWTNKPGPWVQDDMILGLDMASTTGWAVRTASGVFLEYGHEIFRPPKKGRKTIPDDHDGDRYKNLHIFLRAVIRQYSVTHIAYEMPGGGKGRSSALLGFGMRGVLLAVAAFYKIRLYPIAPNSLKLWATGNGHAEKEDMAKELERMISCWKVEWKKDGIEPTHDEVDAIWLTQWLWERGF